MKSPHRLHPDQVQIERIEYHPIRYDRKGQLGLCTSHQDGEVFRHHGRQYLNWLNPLQAQILDVFDTSKDLHPNLALPVQEHSHIPAVLVDKRVHLP